MNSDTPGLNYKQIGAAGIGITSIIETGFIDAIDIWGSREAQGEVCIAGTGRLLMLDATTTPRAQFWLESYQRDGKTCGQFDRPGSVVLMPGEPGATAPTSSKPGTTAAQTDSSNPSNNLLIPDNTNEQVDLANCLITTVYNLNFRESPAGRIVGVVSAGRSFDPSARTPNWFKISYQGREGWISAHYVSGRGDCG